MQAFAQTTPLSLPALPSIPGTPSAAASPSSPVAPSGGAALPALPAVPTPSAIAAPLPAITSPLVPAKPIEKGSETPPPAAATLEPPPPLDGSGNASALPPLTDAAALPLPAIPGLETPATTTPTDNATAIPAAAATNLFANATAIPEIRVVREKAPPKTWETKLAPSIIPPKTNFIYKRELLPEEIYRTQYDRENRHLPRRTTREGYEGLLFTSVARNDVETTRALLNAGTSIKATNAYGETPLTLAQRLGARDVAALLAARGGQ